MDYLVLDTYKLVKREVIALRPKVKKAVPKKRIFTLDSYGSIVVRVIEDKPVIKYALVTW